MMTMSEKKRIIKDDCTIEPFEESGSYKFIKFEKIDENDEVLNSFLNPFPKCENEKVGTLRYHVHGVSDLSWNLQQTKSIQYTEFLYSSDDILFIALDSNFKIEKESNQRENAALVYNAKTGKAFLISSNCKDFHFMGNKITALVQKYKEIFYQ